MENNFVNFIIENIYLFLPIGIIGVLATIILYYTGRNDYSYKGENLTKDFIKILGKKVNFYLILYIFIVIMMFIIGFSSGFISGTMMGGIFSLIPIFAMLIIRKTREKSKEKNK